MQCVHSVVRMLQQQPQQRLVEPLIRLAAASHWLLQHQQASVAATQACVAPSAQTAKTFCSSSALLDCCAATQLNHLANSSNSSSSSGFSTSLLCSQHRQTLTLPGTSRMANPQRGFSSSSSSHHQLDPIHSITLDVIGSSHYSRIPASCSRSRVVAVAVSGGVDSAVSAMLLKRQGFDVFGVYMHNWDPADEAGAGSPTCSSAADLEDAKMVCAALKMPLYEADFVSKYWNSVFEHFLEGLGQGLTPNPDLACNSHIKFGALLQFAQGLGADVLATGHYARLGWSTAEQPATAASSSSIYNAVHGAAAAAAAAVPVLLTGQDPLKDQSYFLAGLNQQQLAKAMFPVGHLHKAQVRQIAAAEGLQIASKRSSAGICFIGRRSFGRFLEEYLPPQPGVYVDVDSSRTLGHCANMLAVTVGQKAVGLGGQQERVYVVGKNMKQGVVHVAAGHAHPALFSSRVLLLQPNWIAGTPPAAMQVPGAAAAATAAACSSASSSGRGLMDHDPKLQQEKQQFGDALRNLYLQSSSNAGSSCSSSNSSSSSAGGPGTLQCEYKARYRQPAARCTIRKLEQDGFLASKFCAGSEGLQDVGSCNQKQQWQKKRQQERQQEQQHMFVAELVEPLRGVTPGQVFVGYSGDVCLGSAVIAAHGPTLLEQ